MTDYHFLCLTNSDLNLSSPTIQGVVYCPGLVCTHCRMSLTYGIILNIAGQLELWGTTCAAKYEPSAWVDGIKPWRHFLHKYEIETCKTCTPREQENLRALALYTQIYPDEVVGKSIYRQFVKNGELDEDQAFHMRSILFGKGWINTFVSRRDLLCRLKILTLLKDKLGEQETMINGLLKLAQSKNFTTKQNRMVFAILQAYGEDLEPYTRSLLSNWPPVSSSLCLSVD